MAFRELRCGVAWWPGRLSAADPSRRRHFWFSPVARPELLIMRCFVAALVVLAGSAIASADEPAGEPSAARGAISRGVDFWPGCCGLESGIIAPLPSRGHGRVVIARGKRAWNCGRRAGSGGHDALDGGAGRRQDRSRPQQKTPDATGMTAVYFGLALEAEPQLDAASAEGLKLFLKTLDGEQSERGSWSGWPDMRPPMLYNSEETITMLVLLVLVPPAASGDEQAKAARDKGLAWLAEAKTDDDPQAVALRLVLWRRLGRPGRPVGAAGPPD